METPLSVLLTLRTSLTYTIQNNLGTTAIMRTRSKLWHQSPSLFRIESYPLILCKTYNPILLFPSLLLSHTTGALSALFPFLRRSLTSWNNSIWTLTSNLANASLSELGRANWGKRDTILAVSLPLLRPIFMHYATPSSTQYHLLSSPSLPCFAPAINSLLLPPSDLLSWVCRQYFHLANYSSTLKQHYTG